MTIWDGGWPDREESEREQDTFDRDEGEEWRGGEPLGAGDEWKPYDWHDGPEYKLWRKALEDEEGS